MAKIKRSLFATFLNVGTLVAPTWALVGPGVTSGVVNYNPKSTEETYIHEDSASISIDSYAPTLPLEASAINGDPVFEFIDSLRKGRQVLVMAETEIVNVWMYETPSIGYYPSEKQPVSLQTDSFGGDGGGAVKVNYTINYLGSMGRGEFSPASLIYTPTPLYAILTTLSIGGLTLDPPFGNDHSWLHYSKTVPNATATVTFASTLTGATIVQKCNSVVVAQDGIATLNVGLNTLTVDVTLSGETVQYVILITRSA